MMFVAFSDSSPLANGETHHSLGCNPREPTRLKSHPHALHLTTIRVYLCESVVLSPVNGYEIQKFIHT